MTSFDYRSAAVRLAALATVVVGCSANTGDEPTGSAGQAQVSDIQSMMQRADGQFDVICKNGSREVVSAEQVVAQQVCGGSNRQIAIFADDRCDPNNVRSTISSTTDCATLDDYYTQAASVRVNGQCVDITNTTLRKACLVYHPGNIAVFADDRCDPNNVRSTITATTDCATLDDYYTQAASVQVNGVCTDLPNTTLRKACLTRKPGAISVFASDSCDPNDVRSSISASTDCATLDDYYTQAASVLVNGVCTDIPNTTLRKACLTRQPGVVSIFASDRCDPNDVRGSLNGSTDCATLDDYYTQAASVQINGVCSDITNTTMRKACQVYHP